LIINLIFDDKIEKTTSNLAHMKTIIQRCTYLFALLILLPIGAATAQKVMDYFPETKTKYPSVNVYSQETGVFNRYVLKDGAWSADAGVPQPPINITKGALVMDYFLETESKYASVNIYSAKTGEFERYILKKSGWEKDVKTPAPPINITKGALVMDYWQETSTKYASMNVYSSATGEFQRFVLKDGKWELDTKTPQPPLK
jgi:hypothetical protein